MFWINRRTGIQTTDDIKVAKWVLDGDKVDVYVWCDTLGFYIREKFN